MKGERALEKFMLCLDFRKGDTSAVWKRIQLGAPFPEWVNLYLAETANSILELGATGKDFRQELVDAVGVKAGHLRTRSNKERDRKIIQQVWDTENRSLGWKTRAYSDIAKSKGMPGEEHVKRIYGANLKARKKQLEDMAEDVMEEERVMKAMKDEEDMRKGS